MAKKGKKNNKQDDYWDEEFEQDQPQADAGAEAGADAGADAGAEDDAPGDFLATLRKNKAKKEQKEADDKTKKESGAPVILSKKEKEKLKKEKEKAKKKEQADKKKAAQANAAAKKKEAALASSSAQSTPAPEEPVEKAAESAPEPAAKAAPKKAAKKVPAGLAALKRQLELKKQAEEEQARLEAEEAAAEEAAAAEAAAKEAAAEEARAAKREKDKARKERLKAEGKLLTKKQKEEKKLQERRRAALLQSGNVLVAGLETGDAGEAPKPKKVVYGSKKKVTKAVETPEPEAKKAAATKTEEEEEVLVDDWEALADDDEVPELWDAEEEEEEETPAPSEPSAPVTPSAAPAATPAAVVAAPKIEEVVAAPKIEEVVPAAKGKKSSSSNSTDLRSPICCILGHVDTGKTKLLDKIRQTNVQGGEAGGITQQIGATYFPVEAIKAKTAVMEAYEKRTFDVPGLLVIDTPGHESFSNLRSRGSSLCNIAILVIDIMHGLEQQTRELIRLLRDRKAPFVVALNKIDRLYDWQATPNNAFRDLYQQQGRAVQQEFEDRLSKIKVELAEEGLNSELYFQNRNMAKYVLIVPTLAVTGEGVPDLLWLLLELTQKRMSKQLMYLLSVEATILEVKVIEGLGTTIDVVLLNGILREGDRVVLCGMNGPIATNIRALLTPPPSRELRIKSEYMHLKEVKAALGVKIAANDLEKAVAGLRLLVVGPDDDEEDLMEEVMDDLTGLLDSVDKSGRGVTVQASTLGSLEALLDFLKDMKIPVMLIGLGPVYKRDVMKATTMLDKAKEFAVMLCFDVKIDKEAEQYAAEQKIQIFSADIIYHLFDAFTAYQNKLLEARRKEFQEFAVFPCVLKTIQIINKRNPMLIGVDVVEGTVRVGTPICAVRTDPATKLRNIMVLGRVVSLEVNHKSVDKVHKLTTLAGVAMRLENPLLAQPVWGRHVDELDQLYSLITRKSIDTLKDPAFRDLVPREDWVLIKQLKAVFDIK